MSLFLLFSDLILTWQLAELERAQLSLQSKVTALETKGATAAEAKADDIPAAAQDVEGNSEPAPAVPAAEEAPEPAAEPATTETTESKPEEAAETTPAEPGIKYSHHSLILTTFNH